MAKVAVQKIYSWEEIATNIRENRLSDIPERALPVIADLIEIFLVQPDENESQKSGPNRNSLDRKKVRLNDRDAVRSILSDRNDGMSRENAIRENMKIYGRDFSTLEKKLTLHSNGKLDYFSHRILDLYKAAAVKNILRQLLEIKDISQSDYDQIMGSIKEFKIDSVDHMIKLKSYERIDVSDFEEYESYDDLERIVLQKITPYRSTE